MNDITNGNGKSETWLVFIVHGFTSNLDWDPGHRESLFARYRTNDRRIIGARVGYGAVSTGLKGSWKFWGCFMLSYVKASTTSMVMGHLLARLSEEVKGSISGTFKTFCIGYSLGAQICSFAGKDYRYLLNHFR